MKYINITKASKEAIALIAKEVAKDLSNGKTVVFPTETVYGLACDMLNDEAVNRVYEIKGRNKNKPLPVMIGNVKDSEFVAEQIPAVFYDIAEKYMPGAVTAVLKKKESVSDLITGGLDTVGVRMPDHDLALSMIRFLGHPIIATSANLSGNPSPKDFSEALKDLKDRCDVFVDGGRCAEGVPSTIIDLSGENIKILRQGELDLNEYIKEK